MTDTVTVLRLENADGWGAFEGANMQDYTDAAVKAGLMTPAEDEWEHYHTSERGFPPVSKDHALSEALDGEKSHLWGTRFGFADAEQARSWFPPCMADALKANHMTLTLWEVPEQDVAYGDRQVVFDKDHATLLERLPVEALYEPSRQLPLPLAA